jgi:hypothetical protein
MDSFELNQKEKAYKGYLETLDFEQLIEEMVVCNRHYKDASYNDEFYFKFTVCRKYLLDAIEKIEDDVDGG